MTSHLTIRMAWHDNNWNGKICTGPEANVYCVGNHSLLSERLARERKIEIEKVHHDVPIDKIPGGYLPPCYYTTNAFSGFEVKVEHKHPFQGAKANKIPDKLPPYSVFTWPFRLSFNHSKKKKQVEGDYDPKLVQRINRFRAKFTPESFVFFYLNYDNPISADDATARGYYVLVGCALIKEVEEAKHFKLDPAWVENLKRRNPIKYKNFPSINWAFPVLYDFDKTGILLPYKEYLERVRKFPEEQTKLERMRVLIEEEALEPYFKYVATDVNDDGCIYLLYKMRKAIQIVQEDSIVDFIEQEKRIEQLLKKAWTSRGLYPSLGKVLDVVSGFGSKSFGKGNEIVECLERNLAGDEDLLERTFKILLSSKDPKYLKPFSSWISALRKALKDYDDQIDLIKKLSLFNLTHFQIERILNKKREAFLRDIDAKDLASNPYLIAEEYVPTEFLGEDKDMEELPDGPIGLFTIDIGMHPDPNYVEGSSKIQDLTPAGPERVRSLIIDYLKTIGDKGDCYANLDDVYDFIVNYPIFYKSSLNITKEKLENLQGAFKKHLEKRIHVEPTKTGIYFYLKEVKFAEGVILETIQCLLTESDYAFEITDVKKFNETEADKLQSIPEFDKQLFLNERNALLSNVLKKHFYVISGKPGSGKTKVLGKIIKELVNRNENVILLAPTGKAALRLQREVKEEIGVEPQTIDRFVYGTEFRKCLENFENILLLKNEKRLAIQNLIIDECSMVDLQRLSVLLEMLWNRGKESSKGPAVNRIILVGDENQLPPIGFGRPFFDIIQRIKDDKRYQNKNYIQLRSNCRSGFDPNILRLAEIYESKNRYYEERLEKLIKGGQVSKGLRVELWKTYEELEKLVVQNLDSLLPIPTTNITPKARNEGLNLLLGLWKEGYVKNKNCKEMGLDNFQILSPYRGETFGTLGLNTMTKNTYNPSEAPSYGYLSRFDHSDKIIRLNNWYGWDNQLRARTLRLSNGSIGVACDNKDGRKYYFPELIWPLRKLDDADNFELAYAITVHKAQGSEFSHVFFVLPKKKSLLTKELLYTALTRSKEDVVLFLQVSDAKSPLQIARERSAILTRNTSIFDPPEDIKAQLWPDQTVPVKSKIEYILYKYLDEAQRSKSLKFKYEWDLHLKNKGITIHPDFTIWVGSKLFYWEHLGILDLERYTKDWIERRDDYEANGFGTNLVTTDDLGGVRDELILGIINDLVRGTPKETPESKFSRHHYQLYS